MTYADLGGARGDIPAAYVPDIYNDCRGCGAKRMDKCINPLTGEERSVPCAVRKSA